MTAPHRPPARDLPGRDAPPAADGAERPRDMRDLGRDGITAMVTGERALRAREVSRPGVRQVSDAEAALERLLSRARGRR